MAGGWARTNDPVSLDKIRKEGETNPAEKERHATLMREGKLLDFDWIGNADKRPLALVEIIEWLLSLPKKYGNAHFVMFSFNYDITQILAGLPRAKAFEICKSRIFDGSPHGGRKFKAPVLYKGYAISYIKSKIFKLWRLRDPDKPFLDKIDRNGNVVINKKTGKPERTIDAIEHITIYDTFGFYQSAFVKVSRNLVDHGYFSAADHNVIVENKAKRGKFNKEPFETVKHYCGLELEALSKATTVLRDGFDRMPTPLRLHAWSGAGSAASALFRQMKLKKEHFPDGDGAVRVTDIPPFQNAAHGAYFGGNIQLMKQGYAPWQPLFGHDIASAYASACVELPSMKGGRWTHVTRSIFLNDDFARFKQTVADTNILSMFLVRWNLPPEPKPVYNRKTKQHDHARPFPFFPLPYRTKNGAILFPSAGLAWIMRDELIGALDWIETFFPTCKMREYIPEFTITEQWRFTPANDARPFAFIDELYNLRASTSKTDTLNQALKLCLSSLYGKLAQSVGGGEGEPPASACPYYAAAITANCRMRVMQAALRSPHEVVMFATDGVVSTKELTGLERVRDVDSGEKPELGDWEMNRLGGGFFLQSGVYVLFDPDGTVKSKKSRGLNPRNMLMKEGVDEFLIAQVLPQWRKPMVKGDKSTHPRVEIKMRKYVTAGSAVVSRERFRVIGRWCNDSRWLDVHHVGVKRELVGQWQWLYISRDLATDRIPLTPENLIEYAALLDAPVEEVTVCYEAGEAFRCRFLAPTIPATNRTPLTLSKPRMPDWIDTQWGEMSEEDAEQLEIAFAETWDDE
jgi:hypothetical protein